mmetsp:Transcript_2593/g.6838  ORF Transcript_2593/g.6838 Transcript_2593/m.6838 type:complete len:224 (-) Transcript_2593:710-1381(-)
MHCKTVSQVGFAQRSRVADQRRNSLGSVMASNTPGLGVATSCMLSSRCVGGMLCRLLYSPTSRRTSSTRRCRDRCSRVSWGPALIALQKNLRERHVGFHMSTKYTDMSVEHGSARISSNRRVECCAATTTMTAMYTRCSTGVNTNAMSTLYVMITSRPCVALNLLAANLAMATTGRLRRRPGRVTGRRRSKMKERVTTTARQVGTSAWDATTWSVIPNRSRSS